MSEYIVECFPSDNGILWPNPAYVEPVFAEEIVRCRDCENFDAKRDGCWWFAHAERQADYSWADEPSDVEPNGFCAWGVRKDD